MTRGTARSERDQGRRRSSRSDGCTARNPSADQSSRHASVTQRRLPVAAASGRRRARVTSFVTSSYRVPGGRLVASTRFGQREDPPAGHRTVHARASPEDRDRSTVARRRAIVASVGVALAADRGLWFLFFGGKGANPIAQSSTRRRRRRRSRSTRSTPKSEATVATNLDKQKLENGSAGITAPTIEKVVTQLLQAGYVDPDGWGDAGSIDGLFTDDAANRSSQHRHAHARQERGRHLHTACSPKRACSRSPS